MYPDIVESSPHWPPQFHFLFPDCFLQSSVPRERLEAYHLYLFLYVALVVYLMDKERDPESHEQVNVSKPPEDAAAKEAPGKVQAFWLLIWMIK